MKGSRTRIYDQPTRVRLEGKAGLLFMKVRFRTDTRLSDHARLDRR